MPCVGTVDCWMVWELGPDGAQRLSIDRDFDHARVGQRLGHESADMVRRTYEHHAQVHAKIHGDNRLDRAF